MYSGNAIAKSAAAAATVTSSFFILSQSAAAHFTSDGLINKGMHHQDVKTLQNMLKKTGNYPAARPANGYFGKATEQAVRQFQKENGLNADGVVGKETKKKLTSFIHSRMDLMARGSNGNEVSYLQEYLKDFGYYTGTVDGRFGLLTERAVINLQKETRIKVDGIVGPETWGSIEKIDETSRESVQKKLNSETAKRSEKKESAPPVSEKPARQKPIEKKVVKPAKSATANAVKEFYANSTAYTAYCNGCSGKTATGINLRKNPGAKVVAVDPSVIPLGTKLYVEGYGYAVAGDTGGAIKGRKIDVFFKNNSDALQWGRRTVKVKVLD
ncbi:peptidoglycan-binding protein [Sporolactobacillus sp. THM7-7]|nr:peptidoglycan-binding protein [Sporolactobacillus sp. THM7-7]